MRRNLAALGIICLLAACSQRDLSIGTEVNYVATSPRACVVGTSRLELRDRALTQSGAATDNLVLGVNAGITGDVNVLGNVTMNNGSVITGNLDLSGSLTQQPGARVTGAIRIPGSAAQAELPTRSFTVGTNAFTTGAGSTTTMPPGNYGAVTLSSRSNVTFVAGTYNFASLWAQAAATLTFDTSAGPIAIQVAGNVTIDSDGRNSPGDSTRVTLYSNGGAVTMHANSSFPGTIIAPNATVAVGNFVNIGGCLGGRIVSIDTDSRITGTGSITVDGADGGVGADAADVQVEAAPDVAADGLVDAGPDSGQDAAPDVSPDVEVEDAALDAVSDVAPDTLPDAAPEDAAGDVLDAPIESGPADAGPDVIIPIVVAVNIQSSWDVGYCAGVTVTNTGTTPISTWTLRLTMNQSILGNNWNANFGATGPGVFRVTPMSWNSFLRPGAAANFGFCAMKTGTNFRPTIVLE